MYSVSYIYGCGIKPERKWCWLQINAGVISLYVGCPIAVGLYQYIERVWSVSGFILHSFSLSNLF